jgi:branched-chain amino acid transport system ATP-binding protein
MLEVSELVAGYGDVAVLAGVSLSVGPNEVVSLVGANGAGKTTMLRAISALLRKRGGRVRFEGEDITNLAPHEIVNRGIAHVPEGRQLFSNMTIEQNLRMGANQTGAASRMTQTLEQVYTLFPRLKERRQQRAGTLSGGEQQMLAIGRGLMLCPKLLILDEPSMGLAPMLVASILDTVTAVSRAGVAVLLVEQNVKQSLKRSERGYVIENGRIVLEGRAEDLLEDPRTQRAFLGID